MAGGIRADREPAVAAALRLADFGPALGEIALRYRRPVAREVGSHRPWPTLSRVELFRPLGGEPPQHAGEIRLDQAFPDVRHAALR
jgi:hypothetical protein